MAVHQHRQPEPRRGVAALVVVRDNQRVVADTVGLHHLLHLGTARHLEGDRVLLRGKLAVVQVDRPGDVPLRVLLVPDASVKVVPAVDDPDLRVVQMLGQPVGADQVAVAIGPTTARRVAHRRATSVRRKGTTATVGARPC